MKELTLRTKIEMVFECKGIKWSYFWQERGMNPSRVNKEFENEPRQTTLQKVWDELGYEVKTGFEEVSPDMTLKQKVKMLCKMRGISMADLAYAIGDKESNLSQKLTRERMNMEEWNRIGEALGVQFRIVIQGDDFEL